MSNRGRKKLFGGLLLGAAVAGAATAWAVQNFLKKELASERQVTASQNEGNTAKGNMLEEDDGVHCLNTRHFEIAGLSHTGKKRSNNQDSYRIGELKSAPDDFALAVVCDGMGGHAGGEVASQIAADLIWTVVSRQQVEKAEGLYSAMKEALERADAAIEQRASKDPDLAGMGTTAVLAAINRDEYIHCYLGDSRLYHFRGREFIYQTKDHSVVRFLMEEGIISADEAKDHPYRSQLTSSLGGGPGANRLTIEPKWDETESPRRQWESGDWLLLCSDGLNSELEDGEIAELLNSSSSPREAVQALRDTVLNTEARDNLTVVVARKS